MLSCLSPEPYIKSLSLHNILSGMLQAVSREPQKSSVLCIVSGTSAIPGATF